MLIRFYYVIDINDPEQIYVGSTIKTLQKRLNCHWEQRYSPWNTSLSQYMKNKQKNDFEIFLIEEKECNKLERDQIENEWIHQIGLMNKVSVIANPEQVKEGKRKWYHKNKMLNHNIS